MGRPHLRRRTSPHVDNNRHIHLLQRLNHAIATIQPLSETAQMLATELKQIYGLHNFVLANYTETQHTIHVLTTMLAGQLQEWSHEAHTYNVFEQVIQRNDICVIDHLGTTNDAWIALPLRFGGSTVGVCAVGPAHRAERYRQQLLALADVVATAIYMQAHTELLELTFAEQSITLMGISEIAQELNATLDTTQIVNLVLLHALETPTVQSGVVLMLDSFGTLTLGAERTIEQSVPEQPQLHQFTLADFDNWDLHLEYQIQPIEQLPSNIRFDGTAKAVALFPLRRDERLSGIVLLGLTTESGIAPLHVQFLKQLTAHAALALSNAMAYAAIEQHRQLLNSRLVQLQAVAHISQAISAHLNIEALLNEIVNVAQSTLGYRSALLSLVDTHSPSRVRRVAATGIPDEQWQMLQEQVVPLANYKTLMAEDFRISRSFYIPHDHQLADDTKLVEIVEQGYRPELGHRAANEWHADDLLLVPLYGHRGGLVGILSVDDPLDRQRPTPETIAVLEIFATQAATAIANAQLYSDLERQALTDNLTGLANQRHFMLHFTQQVSLAQRHGQQLALLALDIDHFKSFNDSFGHLAGNVVLREFADILRQSVRTGDQVARWGGEEFLVLLPQSTCEGALEVAERIRATVHSHSFPHRHISVSVGVAVFTDGMGDDDLLTAADAALYRAKVSRDTVAT